MTIAQAQESLEPLLRSTEGRSDEVYLAVIVLLFTLLLVRLIAWLVQRHLPSLMTQMENFVNKNNEFIDELRNQMVEAIKQDREFFDRTIERHAAIIQKIQDNCHEAHLRVVQEAKEAARIQSEFVKTLSESDSEVIKTLQRVIVILDRIETTCGLVDGEKE